LAKPTVVKKISAYPIQAQLKTALAVLPGQIQKVTFQGFLIEIPASPIQTGDKLECAFELPVIRHTVAERCVAVKIYTHWKSQGAQPPMSEVAAPGQSPAQAQAPTPQPSAPTGAGSNKPVHLLEVHFENLSASSKYALTEYFKQIAKKPS
jgi:hypothetical protein